MTYKVVKNKDIAKDGSHYVAREVEEKVISDFNSYSLKEWSQQ